MGEAKRREESLAEAIERGTAAVMVERDGKKIVRYDLIKSNFFRVVYAEGIFGGISPTGNIAVSFFNERMPIPTHMEHEVGDDGRVGAEDTRARVEREAIVRELEVEVLMNLDNAKVLHQWLGERIAELSTVAAVMGKGK